MSEVDELRDVELMVTGEEDFAEEKLDAVNTAWREQADVPYRELTGIEGAGEPGVDGQEANR